MNKKAIDYLKNTLYGGSEAFKHSDFVGTFLTRDTKFPEEEVSTADHSTII